MEDKFFYASDKGSKDYTQWDVPAANTTGFGAAADDYAERGIDLNEQLIKNKPATFFMRVNSDAMIGAGIHNGDVVIVDRDFRARGIADYDRVFGGAANEGDRSHQAKAQRFAKVKAHGVLPHHEQAAARRFFSPLRSRHPSNHLGVGRDLAIVPHHVEHLLAHMIGHLEKPLEILKRQGMLHSIETGSLDRFHRCRLRIGSRP